MGLTTKEFTTGPLTKKGAIIAAGVIALVLLVAVVAKGCGTDDSARTADDVTGPVSSAAPSAKGSVLPQAPQLQRNAGDPEWLTAAPHRISWQRVDGVPFPFSDSDGPSRIDGAVTRGYSHTPQGAVMAAAHISFRLAWSPDYKAVLDSQTTLDSDSRRALVSARDHSGEMDPDMVAAIAKAPVAFKVSRYTDQAATIYLAFPTPGVTYRFAAVDVVWLDDDWKYTTTSDPAAGLADSDSLDGFTSLEEDK